MQFSAPRVVTKAAKLFHWTKLKSLTAGGVAQCNITSIPQHRHYSTDLHAQRVTCSDSAKTAVIGVEMLLTCRRSSRETPLGRADPSMQGPGRATANRRHLAGPLKRSFLTDAQRSKGSHGPAR